LNTCKECGYIHPPAPAGQCPVAKARELEKTNEGKKLVRFISKLSKYLENSETLDEDINKISNLLGL
jgi:hypothetical protein